MSVSLVYFNQLVTCTLINLINFCLKPVKNTFVLLRFHVPTKPDFKKKITRHGRKILFETLRMLLFDLPACEDKHLFRRRYIPAP